MNILIKYHIWPVDFMRGGVGGDFLAHLIVIIGCPSCVVSRQQLFQTTSPPKLRTGWILTKLGRNDPYMTLF